MKSHILYFVLILTLAACTSRTNECINYDELKLVNEKLMFDNSEYTGCAKKYRGKYTVEVQIKYGIKNGPFKQYKSDYLLEEGTFKNNVVDGSRKRYYPDGKIESASIYKGGVKHGKEEFYWQSGKLGRVYIYHQGNHVDTSYSYFENGTLLARRIYLDGVGNIEVINYLDTTQIPFMSGSMRNGESVGEWTYKFSSDSCFIRHYNNDSSVNTPCNCDTIPSPKI